jgi:acetyl-CoA C-acetyltransferase
MLPVSGADNKRRETALTEVVIVNAVRSAVGKRGGTLSSLEAPDLLGNVYRGLLDGAGVDPDVVEQVVAGCVSQVGQQSGNIARNAWLGAGLPLATAGSTINTQCGSAQQAVTVVHGLIAAGIADVAIAGGVESMTRVPMGSSSVTGLGAARNARFASHWEITTQFEGADRIAARWSLSRDDLDEYALNSQARAAQAIAEGRFGGQIVPVEAPVADDAGTVIGTKAFATDECPRPSTQEGLAGLKVNRKDAPDAQHTPGNSSQIADGAAAILMMRAERAAQLGVRPQARIVDSALVGSDPVLMLTGPIPSTARLLARTGLTVDDIDVFEVNEAFASVVLAWQAETHADPAKVNVNGGAIALGHPLGATGAILITKALRELERTGGRYALIAMCCGGGLGTGSIIERL